MEADWVLPTIPPVLLVLFNFLSPYVVSVLTSFEAPAKVKKVVAVIVSFLISFLLIWVALWVGWVPWDSSPIGIVTLVVIGLLVQQVAYKNFLENSATELMRARGIGAHSK